MEEAEDESGEGSVRMRCLPDAAADDDEDDEQPYVEHMPGSMADATEQQRAAGGPRETRAGSRGEADAYMARPGAM